jgi:SAM-dependent methyltransferase
VVEAPAQRLPFADGSVDTVVSTMVLCTVDAPDLALAEIARVLRPDGRLLFIEHVRSDWPGLARWQDRLAGPWRIFAQGCRCNRPTMELIAAYGFEVEGERHASWHAMPLIVRPLIIGQARKEPPWLSLGHSSAANSWRRGEAPHRRLVCGSGFSRRSRS